MIDPFFLANSFVTLLVITDPGAIVAIMVFIRQAHRGDQRLGVALGLLGVQAVLLLTRISGLLLSAIAVQLVVDAVRAFARVGL